MNFYISIILVFSILAIYPNVNMGSAEAVLECPQISGNLTFIDGTDYLELIPIEDGEVSALSCTFQSENLEAEEIYGEIYAIYNFTGQLTPEFIENYECGNLIADQFFLTFVSSTTHFAAVAFSTSGLLEAASELITQIEEQNLSQLCSEESVEPIDGSEDESIEVQEELDEPVEKEEKGTLEISNEAIKEKSIEEIIEKVEEFKQNEKENIEQEKMIIDIERIVLPDWIKNNAGWWSADQIQDSDFASGIEYMIQEGIIKIPSTQAAANASSDIPGWVKNNAGWWAQGLISNNEFVNGLQYLISNGIITIA